MLFQKFLEQQTVQKKIEDLDKDNRTLDLEKESGVAGTRTHGRGSVPLMSKSDTIPLCHEAKT